MLPGDEIMVIRRDARRCVSATRKYKLSIICNVLCIYKTTGNCFCEKISGKYNYEPKTQQIILEKHDNIPEM